MAFWLLFFVFFPALVIYVCGRIALLDKVGAVVICYATGIILATLGAFPHDLSGLQNALSNYTIPLALPLLFFSIDVRKWLRLAGSSLLSFLLMTVAILISSTAGYFIFRGLLGAEGWKVSGMLIGCYTGGTLNLAAIGSALGVDTNLYNAVNLSDMLVTPVYLLLSITVLQRLLLLILPRFKKGRGGPAGQGYAETAVGSDFNDYSGMFAAQRLRGLLLALGLALLIAGAGGGLSFVFPESIAPVVAILAVSTLGLACSFIPAVRRIPKTFQLGNYFIMVFILAVSSQADLGQLLRLAPVAMGSVAVAVFLGVLIHVALSAIFRIDADTTITTSVAGTFSPPFIPMVATALKNPEMLVTGIITGLIGWVIGTYLGIGYAYLLRALF